MAKNQKYITLKFSSAFLPGSIFIRAFCHGDFSHVDAILPNGSLLGARPISGTKIRPANYEHFTKETNVRIPVTATQEKAFYKFLHKQLGKHYDWRAYISFVSSRDWNRSTTWHCSELMSAALLHIKFFAHELIIPAYRIDPVDLLFVLSAMVPSITDVQRLKLIRKMKATKKALKRA
jgi:hypothetical protein